MEEEYEKKKKKNNKKGKVMVAIDESECSRYALQWTLENLDDKLKSAGLIVFTAISVNFSGVYAASYGAVPIDLMTSIQENRRKLVAVLLEKAKELCATYGVEAETVSVFGDPKDAICDAVQKFHCPMLVMGNNGRGALQRAFVGSVSNYCLNNARCPVLVVKQPS